MNVRMIETSVPGETRRCHLWCWQAARNVEWDRRTLVVGGFSPFGLLLAGVSALASASGTRRRRDEAIRDAAPRWRYVTSGQGRIVDGHLVVTESNGAVRSFDLQSAPFLDTPDDGWIRLKTADGTKWAIEVMPSGTAD